MNAMLEVVNPMLHTDKAVGGARLLTCSEEDYFADPCAVPSLSQSIAHTMVAVSPLHAWAKHPRLGNCADRESSKALDAGTLLHKLLLGAGKEVSVIDAPDFRSASARELRDSITAGGRLPVLKHVFDQARECAAAVRERMASVGVNMADFDAATPEVGIEWTEYASTGPVACRGRLDKLLIEDNRAVIFDVKKIRDAHPRTCARHMIEYGYDIQHTAYTSAVRALRPDLASRIDFIFVFIEDSAPYAVTPARPDGVMRQHGQSRWDRAVELWARCLADRRWPGYAETPISLEAPSWAITQELTNYDRT